MGGTWFFGEADWPSTTRSCRGVAVAVYGGMVLFVRVWYGLFQTLRARGGVPIRPLAYMLALWILPLLAVAPLFSKDVFSYAAQGEMMSRHINPYHYGPGTLGSGPYVSGVDPLWANTPAPYGPLFLMLAGWSASLTFHHALLTIELLRLQSVAGLALIAYCIPKLARSFGRDPGPAFVLAVLNPLTLLALVGVIEQHPCSVTSMAATRTFVGLAERQATFTRRPAPSASPADPRPADSADREQLQAAAFDFSEEVAANSSAESFNATVRLECLGRYWFLDLDDAREKVEEWRIEYNRASQHPSVYVIEEKRLC